MRREDSYDRAAFGDRIRRRMEEQSISVRKLSRLSGLSSTTISRILNGRQGTSLQQLSSLSASLNTSVESLFPPDSLPDSLNLKTVFPSSTHLLLELFDQLGIDLSSLVHKIVRELDIYEQYAQIDEGVCSIRRDFPDKLGRIGSSGAVLDRLQALYDQFFHEDASSKKRAVIGSALLYFVMSTDVIPDYLFPVGYLDDAIAVAIAEERLTRIEQSCHRGDVTPSG